MNNKYNKIWVVIAIILGVIGICGVICSLVMSLVIRFQNLDMTDIRLLLEYPTPTFIGLASLLSLVASRYVFNNRI